MSDTAEPVVPAEPVLAYAGERYLYGVLDFFQHRWHRFSTSPGGRTTILLTRLTARYVWKLARITWKAMRKAHAWYRRRRRR